MERTTQKEGNGRPQAIRNFEDALDAAKETLEPTLRSALLNSGKQLSALAEKASETLSKKGKEVSRAVDEDAHTRPWVYVGGAAALGVILGFLAGRRK